MPSMVISLVGGQVGGMRGEGQRIVRDLFFFHYNAAKPREDYDPTKTTASSCTSLFLWHSAHTEAKKQKTTQARTESHARVFDSINQAVLLKKAEVLLSFTQQGLSGMDGHVFYTHPSEERTRSRHRHQWLKLWLLSIYWSYCPLPQSPLTV